MAFPQGERLAVGLPAGFHILPDGASVALWISEVVDAATSSDERATSLRVDLERLVATLRAPGRHLLAAVVPDHEVASRVVAGGWLEIGPVIDLAEIRTALDAAPTPDRVLNRTVETRESRRAPAVVCRDLIAGDGDAAQTLHERCAAIVVRRSWGVAVRLELSTSDLNAFEDIGATCLQILDRVATSEGIR